MKSISGSVPANTVRVSKARLAQFQQKSQSRHKIGGFAGKSERLVWQVGKIHQVAGRREQKPRNDRA